MAAYCHHSATGRGKLPRTQDLESGPQSPSAVLPTLSHLCKVERGLGAHPFLWSLVPMCLLEVGRAWSCLRPCLKAPPTCHVPPAPACPAVGRFQGLKIALEESQVWGSRREMSLRSRQFHSQTCWGRGIPHGGPPQQLMESPQSLQLCAVQKVGRGCIRSAGGSAKLWADQKSAGACAS